MKEKWFEIGDAFFRVPNNWTHGNYIPESRINRLPLPGDDRVLYIRTARWRGRIYSLDETFAAIVTAHRSAMALSTSFELGEEQLEGPNPMGEAWTMIQFLYQPDSSQYAQYAAVHCIFPGQEILTIHVQSSISEPDANYLVVAAYDMLKRLEGFKKEHPPL